MDTIFTRMSSRYCKFYIILACVFLAKRIRWSVILLLLIVRNKNVWGGCPPVIKPSFAIIDQLLQNLIMRDLQTVGYTQNRTLLHLCGVTGFFGGLG